MTANHLKQVKENQAFVDKQKVVNQEISSEITKIEWDLQ